YVAVTCSVGMTMVRIPWSCGCGGRRMGLTSEITPRVLEGADEHMGYACYSSATSRRAGERYAGCNDRRSACSEVSETSRTYPQWRQRHSARPSKSSTSSDHSTSPERQARQASAAPPQARA